ncbi:MAG: RNA polymerase sigma factor [Pseudomonadota bacterium]
MPLDARDDIDDEVLLIRLGNGDRDAARVLALRMGPRAFAQALRLLGGDRAEAEDVAQEALIRLWKIAPDWRQGEARVTTWLYRVVANLCTDRLRRGRRVAPGGLDAAPELPDETPAVDAEMQSQARVAALEAAIAQLPERQAEAVRLRHIEGLPNPEIAERLDIGVEAVESLTARGKRKLAELLAPRRHDLGLDG